MREAYADDTGVGVVFEPANEGLKSRATGRLQLLPRNSVIIPTMKTALLVGLALAAAGLTRAEQLTGFLADAKCAAGGKAAAAAHADCAKKCVQGGAPVVLVTTENKVYKIKNQDRVKSHVGEKVTLEGAVEGDTIDVQRGRPAE